ncbi:hypothetical protein EDB85DRAFT_879156 [Lactarius pseudohatsudake]|nr:hypothetical protein EDB85DRAFT_879156 [Lactarius pseudohatsudake]
MRSCAHMYAALLGLLDTATGMRLGRVPQNKCGSKKRKEKHLSTECRGFLSSRSPSSSRLCQDYASHEVQGALGFPRCRDGRREQSRIYCKRLGNPPQMVITVKQADERKMHASFPDVTFENMPS